jgi:TolB-like protein/predicted Zn-dependent protease
LVAAAGIVLWMQSRAPDVEPTSPEQMAFPLPEKPSIAVLPFDNLSGDTDQDFWIDGTTDAVITALSKTPNLFVIARDSTHARRDKPAQAPDVAQEFGVRYVLTASIQRAGDRVRVNAQLADAVSGRHVWAEQFDHEFNDLFALQDSLTREVVTALEVELTEGEQARIWSRQTDSWEAYELFRKAMELYRRRTKADNAEARRLFAEAGAIDPDFADATCLVGFTHLRDGLFGWEQPRGEVFAKGRERAEAAIALDPDYPHAYALLGAIDTWEGDIDNAIAQLEKSLALEPNYAGNVAAYAQALLFVLRGAEAVVQIEHAMRLSPYYPDWYLFVAGSAYRQVGRLEDARQAFEQRVERAPKSAFAKMWLAGLYWELGRDVDGLAMMANALQQAPWLSVTAALPWMPYKDHAARESILNSLRLAGLPENPPPPLPDRPSVAVLPFDNMSGDPEQAYFADGMTEDIITDLSKISGLFVIARNSSFAYKGTQTDVRTIARELGVKYVLEGSVRRAGNDVRINAQLIDSATGGHIWAERYDGELADVFDLQDNVTRKIVTALAVQLTTSEQDRLADKGTRNVRAYDAFLQGWEHYRRRTPDDFAKAAGFLENAMALDPEYGRAQAALALIYWKSWVWSVLTMSPSIHATWTRRLDIPVVYAPDRARELLELAMRNPTPLAHQVASEMHWRNGRYDKAVDDANRAIALNANDAAGYVAMAEALIFAGRPTEALPFVETAARLDPHSADNLYLLGLVDFSLGHLESAAALFERALKRSPFSQWWKAPLAATYAHLGRDEEARAALGDYGGGLYTVQDIVDLWPFKDVQVAGRFASGIVKAGVCCAENLTRYLADLRQPGSTGTQQASRPEQPSIAVLPFDNMGGDPAQEYFALGMAEDIITDLSKISALFVVPSKSSFRYKGGDADIRQIGRELGVRYLLEGSVRRAGGQARINAQLIDAETGGQIWAERYDGRLADTFALQDKVTGRIIEALSIKLGADEKAKLADHGTNNFEAHDAFLKGQSHARQYTPEGYALAIKEYERALAIDPNYGRAAEAIKQARFIMDNSGLQ